MSSASGIVDAAAATHLCAVPTCHNILDEGAKVFAVAEGTGSSFAAGVAAQAALYLITERAASWWRGGRLAASEELGEALADVNGMLYRPELTEEDRSASFAGLVVCNDGGIAYRHVGDSRLSMLYQDRPGKVFPLTEDNGNALGLHKHVETKPGLLRWDSGDVALLHTRGVWTHLGPEAIAWVIAEARGDVKLAAERLVELAHRAGCTRTATVVVVRFR